MPFGPDNYFYDFMETDPAGQRSNYFSFQDKFGKAPNQKKWFEDQFQNVQNRYMGQLGQTVRGGGNPTQAFSGFLDNYFAQGGGADQDWAGMSPSQRGVQDSRFAPSVRWNV